LAGKDVCGGHANTCGVCNALLVVLLFLVVRFTDGDNLTAGVEAAIRAYGMREFLLAAVVAGDELNGLEEVMGAASMRAAPREFALW